MYRVGVIGCGGIGIKHASGLVGSDKAELVAGCDLNEDILSSFGEHWADTWSGVALYKDYSQMLAEENLDVLTVATPDNRHADLVVDAAHAGVKAIFCEKPLATSMADAKRMQKAVEDHGVLFSVDHTRRWQPLWSRIKNEVLAGGQIGQVQYIESTHHPGQATVTIGGKAHFLGEGINLGITEIGLQGVDQARTGVVHVTELILIKGAIRGDRREGDAVEIISELQRDTGGIDFVGGVKVVIAFISISVIRNQIAA